MINAKLLAVLSVAAVLASAGVYFSERSPQHAADAVVAHFPSLLDQANQVAKAQIETGDAAITLTRGDSQWTVEQKNDYPASLDQVRALVLGLAELQRIEPKTNNPQLHAKLGLADRGPQSESMLIRLKDQADREILAVMIGKQKPARMGGNRSRYNQYYVRAPTETQVWLTEGRLPSGRDAADWIDKQFVRLRIDEIQSVEVVHTDGERLQIRRDDRTDNEFVLSGLSEGEEVESAYAVNNVPRTLQSLMADDVVPIGEVQLGAEATRVRVGTFAGARIDIAFFKQNEKIYARVSGGNADDPDDSPPNTESADVPRALWQQWVYVIPEHQYDAVSVKKTDLIKAGDPKS